MLKNNFHTLLFISISTVLAAQPEIVSDEFINANTSLVYEDASPQWLNSQNLTNIQGADMIWDITGFDAAMTTEEVYVPPNETEDAYELFFDNEFIYPDHVSTHALSAVALIGDLPLPVELGAPYSFYRNEEDGYFLTGFAFTLQQIPLVTQFDDLEKIYDFPVNYGDSLSDTYSFLTSLPGLGTFGQSGSTITEVDGWGEMITNEGTLDVLRLRTTREAIDTIFIAQNDTGQTVERPTQVDYTWLSPAKEGPVLQISTIQGNAVSARRLSADSVVSVQNYIERNTRIHPNPANEYLDIALPSNEIKFTASLYDVNGKRWITESGVSPYRLNIKSIDQGVYVLLIRTSEGHNFSKKVTIY